MRSPVNSREQTLSEGPVNTGNNDPVTIARTVYRAYVNKDRALMGPLGSEAFYFNSPLDNRLDRAIYFARC